MTTKHYPFVSPFAVTSATRLRHYVLPGLMLLCVIVYLPGLFGGFMFDDFPNIINNPAIRGVDGTLYHWMAAALSSHSGPLRRPVSMLSFALNDYVFGLSPLAFKVVNLTIHLCNGLLLYRLCLLLGPRLSVATSDRSMDNQIGRSAALLTAGFWLLHPLNVSCVLYVVQRMDELCTLFTLTGLLCYVQGRERMLRDERGLQTALVGLVVFGLLAVFSKENGALIMAFALVIECCCYRFAALHPYQRHALKAWYWFTVALPIALFCVYNATHPDWLARGFAGRDFTLAQRLMTEARVLVDYLTWIFIPNPAWMGLYHDDIPLSTGLLTPPTTLLALLVLIVLVALSWKLRRRCPAFAFGVAWFLVGQSMESTIIPLELVFEHRNYLPMTGLLLGAVCTLTPWFTTHRKGLAVALGVATTLALACLTTMRAWDWGSPLRLATTEARHHPHSARSLYDAGREIIFAGTAKGEQQKAENTARSYFERAMFLNKTYIYPATALILTHADHGQAVPQSAIDDLAYRLHHADPFSPNPFLALLTAAAEGKLVLDPAQYSRLVNAALANPVVGSSVRAMIFNDYGSYQFRILHDVQNAVSLTLAAAAEDPKNPLFQINLAKLALAVHQPEIAAKQLKLAVHLDGIGEYKKTIARLHEQIRAQTPPD